MVTVRLNAAYFPTVEMLSGIALAVIVLYGGYQAIDGHITAGTVVAFVADAVVPVRTDPAALPALHHLPVGDGGAGEDLPAARRHARPDRPGRTRRELDRIRGEVRFEDVSFAYSPRRRTDRSGRRALRRAIRGDARRGARGSAGARAHRPDDPARPDGRARGRHRRRQVDDGQARRALLRPDLRAHPRRRARPARGLQRLAALADGDRAAGGVPVLRHRRARTSPSAGPTPSEEQVREAAAAVGARGVHRGAARTATTPRSASAARSCPPASASCSRSPAR